MTAIKGGNPPDVAVILAVDTFTLYDEDAILAYDDLIGTDEERAWLDSFYPAFMENGRIEGEVWGIPFQRSSPVLYWNKDAFAEAGLDPDTPPATWEEQAAALGFVKWLTSPEQTANWCISTGYVATSQAAWETERMQEYAANFPPATVARDQLEFATAELSTHENQRITKIFNDARQAALTLAEEPATALADAQAEADRVLSAYR